MSTPSRPNPSHFLFAFLSAIALLAVLATRASALAPIISNFDTNLDGWTTNAIGTPQYQSSGGNPGGFADMLRFASTPDLIATAPPKFTGNLSAYDGQTIAFDAGLSPSQPDTPLVAFGTIDIYYNSLPTPISQDIASGIPGLAFQTYSGPFTAAGFGVSPATWATALSTIDAITIDVSTYNIVSAFSPVAFDNITITPEPASLSLLLLSTLPLLHRRRR